MILNITQTTTDDIQSVGAPPRCVYLQLLLQCMHCSNSSCSSSNSNSNRNSGFHWFNISVGVFLRRCTDTQLLQRTSLHACIYLYTFVYMHVSKCVYIHMLICIYLCALMCMHLFICLYLEGQGLGFRGFRVQGFGLAVQIVIHNSSFIYAQSADMLKAHSLLRYIYIYIDLYIHIYIGIDIDIQIQI